MLLNKNQAAKESLVEQPGGNKDLREEWKQLQDFKHIPWRKLRKLRFLLTHWEVRKNESNM